ncbi:lipoyl(octanoyl) transferase LipB [Frigoribacterium sp. 2-23]|uniref:lipoyl(octanoyl) transferase LipB n=1 Tax=Frigoribacterium sp. 2-23 TaxID=3415006 RepID=UPI003C6EA972
MTLIERHGIASGEAPLPYLEAWTLQRRLHGAVVARDTPGALVLCQHPSVYTAGTRTQPDDLPRDGSPVVEADRGGRITWHGPGQLVAYPIVRLPEPLDVVAFVRELESCLIEACATVGVVAERIDGRSGAWVRSSTGDAKVGAVGIRVAEGVTMHGVSLNCDNSLAPYDVIVPCGIADAGVTTLTRASGRIVTPHDVADALEASITALIDRLDGATASAGTAVAA